jgi:hypothetical protein
MEKIFEIELSSNKIDDYEDILSRFSNWRQYKREINLNQLLEEGKKIEFEVEISNGKFSNQGVLYVSVVDKIDTSITSLVNVCSVIKKMTFIILNNEVLKLSVEITTLTTKWGKIITNLLESGIDLKLIQHKNIEGKIDNFYFIDPSLVNDITNSIAA